MEKKVFIRPAVAGVLEGFVEARLHTDGSKNIDQILKLQTDMTQSVANPVYLVVDPATGEILSRRDGATLQDDQPFIDFLNAGINRAKKVAKN
ncbi:MAG: hypothetical protein ACI841_002380 [Planctomycetota bacterium]|jgi:hypothetical protein